MGNLNKVSDEICLFRGKSIRKSISKVLSFPENIWAHDVLTHPGKKHEPVVAKFIRPW